MTVDVVLENSEVLTVLKDHYGAYLYASPHMLEAFDEPPTGFIGKSDYHFMSDEDAVIIRANDKLVLNSGQELKTVESAYDRDGVRRSWWVLKFPVRFGGARFVGVLAVALSSNVAEERQRAEEALQQQGAEIRQALCAIAEQFARESGYFN